MLEWKANEEAAREVTRKIVDFCQPERVVLFGSLARGESNKHSDLDLLVIWDAEPSLNAIQRRIALRKAIGPTMIPMDILALTPAEYRLALSDPRSFTSQIVSEGRVLYERLQ